MTEIKPFSGLRYDTAKAGPLETLVAPPYDVVDKKGRDSFTARNPFNIFSAELPDPSDCSNGLDQYQCAASIFSGWMKKGIMHRDPVPAIYPYEIEFSTGSSNFRRTGFIALVRLADWSERQVLPHEQTFDKVTEDRFRLTEATRIQFSPVFMLYRNNPEVQKLLREAGSSRLYSVSDSAGNPHTLSTITDPDITAALVSALADSPLYIADGHHRYTTALRYRDFMRKKTGNDQGNMPFDYIMTYLVDAEDPGLIVLPTHRIVKIGGTDFDDISRMAADLFHIENIEQGEDLDNFAKRMTKTLSETEDSLAIGAVSGNSAQIWRLRDDMKEAAFPANMPKALKQLDVVLLDHVILRKIMGFDSEAEEKNVNFSADAVAALKVLGDEEMLFFMRPTPVHQVLDIADQGLTMPHKSTYFYPKILSGMVLNSVGDEW